MSPQKRSEYGTGGRSMVGVRLADDERRAVEQAARAAGLAMGAWLRIIAVEAASRTAAHRPRRKVRAAA